MVLGRFGFRSLLPLWRIFGKSQKFRSSSGQMTVELAVLVPVVIVVALTVFNLMRFVSACSAFDRIAADAVVSQGVSPKGEAKAAAVNEVEQTIKAALDMHSCSVEVHAEPVYGGDSKIGAGIGFPVSPLLTRFVCTLRYKPWPSSFVIAGVVYRAPISLEHTRTLVIDRYRGGVVM